MMSETEPEKSAADKTAEHVLPCADLTRDIPIILNSIIQTPSVPRFSINPVTCIGSERAAEMYEATDLFPSMGHGGRWFQSTVDPVRDAKGVVPTNASCPEKDAGYKKLERELHLVNKKLNLMNSIAWHEIENKITGARGYVELSKEFIKDENGRRYFEAEENILSQVYELLQFTKDYQKIGTCSPQWMNVMNAVQSSMCLIKRDSLLLDLDVNASLELFGDLTLNMLFSALINYTIKNKKNVPEIRISVAKIPEGLRLTYEDNSVGIPFDRKRNLFSEKIVKADNFCMKYVHDILEFSGMSITETGDPERGRRFEIIVPEGLYRIDPPHEPLRGGYR